MKKYVATINNETEEKQFKVIFDYETKCFYAEFEEEEHQEEILDIGSEPTITDELLVKYVYDLYNHSCGFEIVDCIEF